MVDAVLAKIFGTKHEREVKRIKPKVEAINNLEPAMQKLSDAELAAKTTEFKQRLANGETLDDLLVEAFAVCREAGRRVLNMRHFDVQLIGGAVLHQGKIAEMRTGEGKTLVATLPCYLNALEGKGVHVITVNDYLAKRDSEWMGRIHTFLGLTIGCITHDITEEERRNAYACDITYGTNNEFGFDYLRDNMKFRIESCVQREHNFAIVDEVDSILIDESRTPLIISGPSEESTDKYYRINTIIPKLVRGEVIEGREAGEKFYTGDYTVDEKQRNVALTEEGVHKVERLLNCGNLYDIENMELNHHVQQGLRAAVLYQRDREYVVQNGEVVIVDEFTGRLMPGRRWSDGLHQAVEAKEGVKIERENQTLATITFQNYFRMYKKLAGMTGTADTEAAEFGKTYKLDVVQIPTNQSMIRKDLNDIVYRTEEEKYRNAAVEIKALHEKGQPVLVGTISVEKSEKLSAALRRAGVRHEVLNAKNHEREAHIIAQAGRKGAVTVSTNMAGRGTDILLGGNAEFLAKDQMHRAGKDPEGVHAEEFKALYASIKKETDLEHDEVSRLGGLFVLGTERHESRRIDNQLRGRAGRQGDPGGSRFYLSLQDDLLRIFGGDKIQGLMLRLGMEEDVPIESSLITRRIEAAQKSVEANHFSARKHLLEYDDVMNKQRQAVYGLRRAMLTGVEQKERIREMVTSIAGSFIDARLPEGVRSEEWDFAGLEADVLNQFGLKINTASYEDYGREAIEQEIIGQLNARYDEKELLIGSEAMRETERYIVLNIIDNQWKDHLLSMDHLKEGIYLRGYGQKDPLIEYKKESFTLFQDMMARMEDEAVKFLYSMQVTDQDGNILTRAPIQIDEDGDLYSDGDDEEYEEAPVPVAAPVAPPPAIADFTRNIQRKKEKELEALQYIGGDTSTSSKPQPVVKGAKIGRNDLCPCGSGKKYKKCHGA
ncbi:preprotein translocase subunit SecA [Bryobacter aggregatus]|uniref:preprotein translocase subunit SecA n=1 Tax=Bryobacter aggregatus TaxID=360054 RepID=UPI0004E10664|nr:preprotein translocase subunit SecA [Bryobacter aggregatus]